ncbi:MAG: hypothetical protein QXO40_05595 [Candidatus Aenigmatarchaeota archaeon]
MDILFGLEIKIYISIISLLVFSLSFIFGLIFSIDFKRYSNFSLFNKFLNINPLFFIRFPNSSIGFISTIILEGSFL